MSGNGGPKMNSNSKAKGTTMASNRITVTRPETAMPASMEHFNAEAFEGKPYAEKLDFVAMDLQASPSENILFEANALTSAIVDCMHGVLPTRALGDSTLSTRTVDLIRDLLNLADKRTRQVKLLALDKVIPQKTLDKKQESLFGQVSFQIWHEVCLLRRIISRVVRAVKGEFHISALNAHTTQVPPDTLGQFCRFRHDLTNLVVEQAYTIVRNCGGAQGKGKSKVKWFELAIMYEATLVLRGRGLITPAIALARDGENMIIEEDGFVPEATAITGLVSFNPELFTLLQMEEVPETGTKNHNAENNMFLKSQSALFTISKAITLNSKESAIQGTTQLQHVEVHRQRQKYLKNILLKCIEYIRENGKNIRISSLLQIESMLRVICHNLINQTGTKEHQQKISFRVRVELSIEMDGIYQVLEEIVNSNEEVDRWMRQIIFAKIRQDGGILLSNIVPAGLLKPKDEETDEEDVDDFDRLSIALTDRLEDGWPTWKDCPARIRQRYRSAILKDMMQRSRDLESLLPPQRIFDLIGDPIVSNPFTKGGGGLSPWFWGIQKGKRKSMDSTSKHLRYFPQSNINRAQVSITMAYMQLLLKLPENNYFANIEKMITKDDFKDDSEEKAKQNNWKVSRVVTNRLQFTIGHLMSQYNEKPLDQLIATTKSSPLVRKNVTRINRMDPLMFAATAMNYLEELITKDTNRERMEKNLDRAARLCDLNLEDTALKGENIHIHDVIHAAQEAAQSPMRLPQKFSDANVKQEKLVDQILRVSFSRLYFLTIRVEQIARLLRQAPLRQPYQDSSVLILDQVRVLLKFMHTDWLTSEAQVWENNPPVSETMIDPLIVKALDKLRKSKGHLGHHFSKELYPDRYDADIIRGDLEIEYVMSNALPRRGFGSMRSLVEKNRERLNFNNFSFDWSEDFLKDAIMGKYEGHYNLDQEDQERMSKFFDNNDSDSDESVPPGNTAIVTESYRRICKHTEREWILWSRLVFFPVAFDGRTIVSSTTFSEINENQDGTATSLLWGKMRTAFLSDSESMG